MWPQAWTETATDVDRHMAVLLGDVFVGASWAFGDVVSLENVSLVTPTMGDPSMVTPTLGNPNLETA